MKFEQLEQPQTFEHMWLIGFLALTLALFFLPITHDAIGQIWIGRELLHGAGLYTDIIEVNPPLWFWLAVPLLALVRYSGSKPG